MNEAATRLAAAAEALPAVRGSLAAGRQFNAYEAVRGGWYVCLGPVTDAVRLAACDDDAVAELLVAALRIALQAEPVGWQVSWTRKARGGGSTVGGATIERSQSELNQKLAYLKTLHFVDAVTVTPLLAGAPFDGGAGL